MTIANEELLIRKSELKHLGEAAEILEKKFGSRLPRWYIARVDEDEIPVELTRLKEYHEPVSYPPPEAAGILQVLKKGISISSLYRPLATLKFPPLTGSPT